MYVNSVFRFHRVGQGLFYSGIITKTESNHHSTFSFVYDCGSESSKYFLYREIDDFKELFPKKKRRLDMLVISHLHEDHINGLEYLFDYFEVDTVVMPYVSDGLKLLARLELKSDDEFLEIFYTDPVAWFVSKGVKRILLLGSEGAEDIYIDDRQRSYVNNYEYDGINIDGVMRNREIDNTEILYLERKSEIEFRKFYWEFCFENLELDINKEKSYIKIVEDFMRQRCLTLEQILKSKQITKELKYVIEQNYPHAQNRTSVVLLHRPTMKNCLAQICFNDYCYRRWHENLDLCVTALTGDIELRRDDRLSLLDESNYYLVFQYPHHGSKNNDLNRLFGVDSSVNVISHGLINRYGHPDYEVLTQIHNAVLVNERKGFDYQISIV